MEGVTNIFEINAHLAGKHFPVFKPPFDPLLLKDDPSETLIKSGRGSEYFFTFHYS